VGIGAEERVFILSSVDIKRQLSNIRVSIQDEGRESNKGYGQSLWAQQYNHSQRFFPEGPVVGFQENSSRAPSGTTTP
jgi:hypothetical protein